VKQYIEFYNTKRFHQSLDYKTPAKVYFSQTNEVEESWATQMPAAVICGENNNVSLCDSIY